MKATTLRLFVLGLGFAAVGALVACSGDDNSEPTPTTHDSGVIDSSVPATDSGNGGDTGVAPDSGPGDDSGPPIDAALPDVGTCASDSSTCNSCYTPVTDPVNGCSPAAANCVKFDNSRVPANAP